MTRGFRELSSLQNLGQASLGDVEVLFVVRPEIVAEAAGADRQLVAMVSCAGVALLLGGQCRQGGSPWIGGSDARVPEREEGAVRRVPEVVAAHGVLPGEDASHCGRVLADDYVLVKQVSVNDVASLRTCVEESFDAVLARAEEAIELGVMAERGAPACGP